MYALVPPSDNSVTVSLREPSYRQMAGRAGRKGAGRARGEALIVAANKGQATRASGLMNAGLAAVKRRGQGRSFGVVALVRGLGPSCVRASFPVTAHAVDTCSDSWRR